MADTGAPMDSPFVAAKPEETLPLFQAAVARKSRLQCWSEGQRYSYTSRIVKVHETSGLILISVAKEFPGGDEFETALIREAFDEILFSLHLPTDILFFKGEPRRGEAGFFNARVKIPVFKAQRRTALRLPVSPSQTSSVVVHLDAEPPIGASLVNVSEGGLGISVMDRADFERLAGTKSSFGVQFEVYGFRVDARAIFKHGAETGSALVRKSFRIGIAFEKLDPKIQTRLSQLVFEESAKFIGRF